MERKEMRRADSVLGTTNNNISKDVDSEDQSSSYKIGRAHV